MKKLYSLTLAALLTLSSQAAVPFQKNKTPQRQSPHHSSTIPSRAAELQILFDEDFSKFSDGTENEPGNEIIYNNGYYIPESYTSQPGWTGQGIRPAGGCVSLNPYNDSYGDPRDGYISTPKFMANGTATITFRAKTLGSNSGLLWAVMCDDMYGPGDDQIDAELTDQWQAFTLVASNGSLETPSWIQFSALDCVALIDDIKIEFRQDRIATPYALNAVNVSPTEFVASWEEVNGAEAYLLNIICTSAPENIVSGELTESFDGIKINPDGITIDKSDPNYPEGWKIIVNENGTQDVSSESGNFNSAPLSLKFDAVGDTIESASTPEPIDRISFWCKPTVYNDNYEYMSLIRLEIYHSLTDKWENIAHLGYFNFPQNGGFYTVNEQSLGNDVTKVRLTYLQKGTPDFYIDDIKLHYTTRGITAPMLTDLKVEGTEYTVKDIDPRNEYSYFVKAYRDDIVSSASSLIWVDGIAGLQVQTDEASDISPTSFTASWQPLGHASNYSVNVFKVLQPTVDLNNVTVIEETFDNINEGSVENPSTDWQSPFDFGAKGWAATSWCATQPAWAKGMAGTTGTNIWMGIAGLVYTPVLDLSCYDGKGITVDATFVTTVDSFDYNGSAESEGVFALVMNSSDLSTPIASGYLDTPTTGSTSGRIIINNVPADADLSNVVIAFMNKSGLAFFVDYAKISMNVPAGTTLSTPLLSIQTENTSYKFEGLDPQSDHAFSVIASANHNYESFVSDASELRIVRTSTSAVSDVTADAGINITTAAGEIRINAPDDTVTEVYNTAGVMTARGKGTCVLSVSPGLYIVRSAGQTSKIAVR